MHPQLSPESNDHAMLQLENKRVLLIGGNRKPEQFARLKRAFPQTLFEWIPTRRNGLRASESISTQRVRGFDYVAIVVGLARHAHSLSVKNLCAEAGVPLLWIHRPTPTALICALSDHARLQHVRNN